MFRDQPTVNDEALIVSTFDLGPYVERPGTSTAARQTATPSAYRVKLGRETVWLPPVEYSILRFLAARPYRPFSKARIAAAVTSARLPVTENSLSDHIKSLRGRLGFFRDYIQLVPYMGYRFKA